MKCVGIHLDSRKVLIAEVEDPSNKPSLSNLIEMDRHENDQISDVIKNAFLKLSSKPDRVFASIGNTPLVIRNFSFPFKDRTRVQAAIQAEFEDTLPIEIDNYIIEYQQIGKEKNLYTFLGALIARNPVEDINKAFEKLDVLPSDFLVPGQALGRMGLNFLAKETKPLTTVCFCDIGFETTQISIVQFPAASKILKASLYANSLIEFRHLTRGSKDIYERELAQKSVSVREFENWLTKEVSFSGESPELDNLKNSIRPLFVELYQVTQAAASRSGKRIEQFILTGPLSHSTGFRELFEHELRTPTIIWDPYTNFMTSKVTLDAYQRSHFILPLALSLRHGFFRSLPWLNFRRSSKQNQLISSALHKLQQPHVKSVLLPVALMIFGLFFICTLASTVMNPRLKRQADRTANAFSKSKIPLGSKKETLISNPSSIKDKFEEFRQKKLSQLPSTQAQGPFIEDLLKLSEVLDSKSKVEELRMVANNNEKEIQVTVDTSKDPNFQKTDLEKDFQSKGFSEVSINAQNGKNFLIKAKRK
jgi:Tfp pilus assembly PilM family ATPase